MRILFLVAAIICLIVSFLKPFFQVPLISFFTNINGPYLFQNIYFIGENMGIGYVLLALGPLVYLLGAGAMFIYLLDALLVIDFEKTGDLIIVPIGFILLLGLIVYPGYFFIFTSTEGDSMFDLARSGFYFGFFGLWGGFLANVFISDI